MLTRSDLQAIKEIVKGEVNPVKEDLGSFKKAVKENFGSLRKDMGFVQEELGSMKQDLGSVKEDLGSFKKAVKEDFGSVKKQLNTVEMKVELVTKRVEQAQEETINSLTELIHTGYSLHEERIKKIEDHLKPSRSQ